MPMKMENVVMTENRRRDRVRWLIAKAGCAATLFSAIYHELIFH
jgi:hypothetical protein